MKNRVLLAMAVAGVVFKIDDLIMDHDKHYYRMHEHTPEECECDESVTSEHTTDYKRPKGAKRIPDQSAYKPKVSGAMMSLLDRSKRS